MSYSTDRALQLSEVLKRFATLNAYQLASHRPNLEFWVTEAVHTIGVLDGYRVRFQEMRRAQTEWVEQHDLRASEFCRQCDGECEFGPEAPPPPRRVPSAQIDEARQALRDGAREFFLRLYAAFMLDRHELETIAERLGTGFEPPELEREEPV